MASSLFNPGPFTYADRLLCERIAAELYTDAGESRVSADGDAWACLAARISRVLRGEYTRFAPADVSLVSRTHVDTLRRPLADGARERSAALSRLGVLVLEASRGRLADMQAGAA